MSKNVELTVQEVQAVINTLNEIPTKYGAGLVQFFAGKAQETAKKDSEVKEAKESKVTKLKG